LCGNDKWTIADGDSSTTLDLRELTLMVRNLNSRVTAQDQKLQDQDQKLQDQDQKLKDQAEAHAKEMKAQTDSIIELNKKVNRLHIRLLLERAQAIIGQRKYEDCGLPPQAIRALRSVELRSLLNSNAHPWSVDQISEAVTTVDRELELFLDGLSLLFTWLLEQSAE
jgi:multidrug resistance efflux pump